MLPFFFVLMRCAVAVAIGLVFSSPSWAQNGSRSGALASLSCGSVNGGALIGIPMPKVGFGFLIASPWRERESHYATAEMVDLLTTAAAEVADLYPGATLAIADISNRSGGQLRQHRSHQSGRDVDLIYYALDENGVPFTPDNVMPYFGPEGLAHHAKAPRFSHRIDPRYFDLARNWALVRALLSHPSVHVVRIFVSDRVREWLLRYASARGESWDLVARARWTLRRASESSSHNDHMHVRIGCSRRDLALGGCQPEPSAGYAGIRVACPANAVAQGR